ncbi:cupin domain-containing protein [Naasia sp. SYSU D00948]|uniref:cupin domain-containing protein n=1 Tax=Naasia sp. SYSU D00948 TaxID=2817379 RepID=UPI001B3100CC|nr:cupin domain-containing protein [Naasia sp. SYSU D00948]
MTLTRMPAFRPSGAGVPVATPWHEALVRKVDGSSTGGAFSVLELTAAADWSRPPYVHHQLDECFYVVEGSFLATVETADAPLELSAGSVLFVPRGVLRSLRAMSSDSRLVLVTTPGCSPGTADLSAGIELVEPPHPPVPDSINIHRTRSPLS